MEPRAVAHSIHSTLIDPHTLSKLVVAFKNYAPPYFGRRLYRKLNSGEIGCLGGLGFVLGFFLLLLS